MAVRNFWLQGSIDGRRTKLQGGPASKSGGFELAIMMRSKGAIVQAATVRGTAGADGRLTLTLENANESRRIEVTTDR